MSVPYARVIVNPVAGGGSVRRQWPHIKEQLNNTGLSFDYEFTNSIGHAAELARQAAETGYNCVVVVGGDGTVNEVANGILNSSRSDKILLGIVSAGSACSFARSLGIVRDYAGACSRLMGKSRAVIDVGVVQCQSDGHLIQRYFVNFADVGLGSAIVDAWRHLPGQLGRGVNHTLRTAQALKCLFNYRNASVKLQEGDDSETIVSSDIIISNGQYFGDGMQIAPHAKMDDGLLDVLSVRDLGRSELLKIWPRLYSGSHIGNSKIKEAKTTCIKIESEDVLLVEADGVILGQTPASFWVTPAALTVAI
jgi:diacylglycerol kinase (ATP)